MAALPARVRVAGGLGGRYRLDEPLRTVDGAALWRGTDEVLNRLVTIWELRPDRAVPLEVIAAVLGAAGLSDPRIARIFDADCASERPYIVTEWVPGRPVDDLLRTGLPDVWTAVSLTVDAASALAVAHRAGIAHQCLTPASVMYGRGGLKITGVGLEAALCGASDPDPAGADARALGGLLYALLTGYWPGAGGCRLPAAPRYRGELCPPGEVRDGIPDTIGEIVTSALQHGDRRGQPVLTADQLASELRKARRVLRPLGPRPQESRALAAQPLAAQVRAQPPAGPLPVAQALVPRPALPPACDRAVALAS